MAKSKRPIKSGDKFNRLEAVQFVSRSPRSIQRWEFKCECGNRHVAVAAQVKAGNIKSCGCLFREKIVLPRAGKHKMIFTSEYRVWGGMLNRCYNPSNDNYPGYGARGIAVCNEWQTDFARFFKDMGKRPSPKHTLDRIDNDGNYEPGNCKWSTAKEQATNRRNTIIVNVLGKDMPLSNAAVALGVPYPTAWWRFKHNRSLVRDT